MKQFWKSLVFYHQKDSTPFFIYFVRKLWNSRCSQRDEDENTDEEDDFTHDMTSHRYDFPHDGDDFEKYLKQCRAERKELLHKKESLQEKFAEFVLK